MVSGLARPCIVEEVVAVAREVGADTVAHGCTGKGNDQVRFEVGFYVLAPDLKVLAPIRDADIPREKAIALAEEWGIPHRERRHDRTRSTRTCGAAPRSADRSRTPGSPRRRTRSNAPPRPPTRPEEPAEIAITFERGVPVALDGAVASLPEIVRALDALAGSYGFGRVDMIENRRVGHQEPRAVRGAGRTRHHPRAPGARGPDARARGGAPQAAPGAALGRPRVRRPVVRARCVRRSTPTSKRRSPTSPARCGCGSSRGPASWSGVAATTPSTIFGLATYGSEDAFDQSDAEGYVRLYGLPLKVWSAKQGSGPR